MNQKFHYHNYKTERLHYPFIYDNLLNEFHFDDLNSYMFLVKKVKDETGEGR